MGNLSGLMGLANYGECSSMKSLFEFLIEKQNLKSGLIVDAEHIIVDTLESGLAIFVFCKP